MKNEHKGDGLCYIGCERYLLQDHDPYQCNPDRMPRPNQQQWLFVSVSDIFQWRLGLWIWWQLFVSNTQLDLFGWWRTLLYSDFSRSNYSVSLTVSVGLVLLLVDLLKDDTLKDVQCVNHEQNQVDYLQAHNCSYAVFFMFHQLKNIGPITSLSSRFLLQHQIHIMSIENMCLLS